MAKLSGAQMVKLESLEEARRKWDRVRKLVEQAAASPKSQDDLIRQCLRTSSEVGRFLSSNGFGALANHTIELASVIRRPGTVQAKIGAMREAVGKAYVGFDRVRRDIERS